MDRSLTDQTFSYEQESRLITLERLANGGYFRNNRQMIVNSRWQSVPQLLQVIRSMADLETLSLLEWKLTLTQNVPQLLRSCPNLTELRLNLAEKQIVEMNEEIKNELRPGFQRLKICELTWDKNSCPIIQEMFT